MLVETLSKHKDQYFEDGKVTKENGKKLIHNDMFLTLTASFDQKPIMDAITNPGRIEVSGSTSITWFQEERSRGSRGPPYTRSTGPYEFSKLYCRELKKLVIQAETATVLAVALAETGCTILESQSLQSQ